MFRHVLVATDLSEASTAMLSCLESLRLLGTKEVTLVHVLPVRDVGGLALRLRELQWPALEAQQRALERMGYRVHPEIPIGEPHYEINRLAEESGASLVVLGSHGAGIGRALLLGSVSGGVLQTASVPALVVRIRLLEEEGGRRCAALCQDLPQRVLFPTDFSDTAERAFGYVERVVETARSSVTLLHVQDRARLDPHLLHRLDEFNAIDRARLERLSARLVALGAKAVAIDIVSGFPAPVILERAQAHSLVMMGGQGRGYIRGEFLGSITQKVLRRAPTAVLVVPPVR